MIEQLPAATSGDCAAIVENVLQSTTGRIDSRIAEVAAKRVRLFLDSPVFVELQSAQRCFQELDFVLRRVIPHPWITGGEDLEVLISGQIDCLYLSKTGRWNLIDFKTGGLPRGGPDTLVDSYAVQLALYAAASEPLLAKPPDDVAIVHVADSVQRFPRPMEPPAAETLQQRTTAAIHQACRSALEPND